MSRALALARRTLDDLVEALSALRVAAWGVRAEILHTGSIVVGWTLVTWGVAELLVWQVWPISAGAFLLSSAGWGHLRLLATRGLYHLTRPGS